MEGDILKVKPELKRQRAENWTEEAKMKTLADENVCKIANVQVKCREELHKFQIETEEKKQRNLDLEAEVAKKTMRNLDLNFEIMQAKLAYYKKKSFDS